LHPGAFILFPLSVQIEFNIDGIDSNVFIDKEITAVENHLGNLLEFGKDGIFVCFLGLNWVNASFNAVDMIIRFCLVFSVYYS
jgi:hypothetical protein